MTDGASAPLEELVERFVGVAGVSLAGPSVLAVQRSDGQLLPVEMHDISDGVIELRARWSSPITLPAEKVGLEGLARAVYFARAGLLRCDVLANSIQVRTPVFLDGLTRQEFVTAACEIAKAHDMLDASVREWDEQRSAGDLAGQTLAQIETEMAESERAFQEFQDRQIVREAERRAAAAEPAPAKPAAAKDAPPPVDGPARHEAPVDAPPVDAAPVAPAKVDAATEAAASAPTEQISYDLLPVGPQVVERRDGWAYIVRGDGWEGWVDGRSLQ